MSFQCLPTPVWQWRTWSCSAFKSQKGSLRVEEAAKIIQSDISIAIQSSHRGREGQPDHLRGLQKSGGSPCSVLQQQQSGWLTDWDGGCKITHEVFIPAIAQLCVFHSTVQGITLVPPAHSFFIQAHFPLPSHLLQIGKYVPASVAARSIAYSWIPLPSKSSAPLDPHSFSGKMNLHGHFFSLRS